MATLNDPIEGDSLGLTQERLGFTLFMSLCVHAVLILGVGFTLKVAPKIVSSMEITLASYKSNEAPDNPDFLAQANQKGSGTADRKLAPATPRNAPFVSNSVRNIERFMQERPTAPAPDSKAIVARANGDNASTPAPDPLKHDLSKLDSKSLGNEVASLQAQLDLQRQEYAKRPRKYTISSASTKESRDAAYLDSWRKRIEGIGNLNYPEEASRDGIYGTLRLMVSINPDGTVNDIRILRSSGERVLDEAAVRIVQLSAPFQPLPPAMRKDIDVLEIIRTWQFQRGNTFSSF
ncbi:MAG TPA: energy transducer TonB [Candidatus Acidoferrum sp.]|nr:energy transducer TonB [Candidatus Acidoferrum sp.]